MKYQRYDATLLLEAEVTHGVHGSTPAALEQLFASRDRVAMAATCEMWADLAIQFGGMDDRLARDLFADAERILAGEQVEPWMTPKAAA